MCLAFGVDSLDDAAAKLGSVLEMQPPEGLVDKVRGLKKLKSIADSRPKTVRSAAPSTTSCSPATTSTSTCSRSSTAGRATRRRSSRCPAVITHDPKTGTRNVGMYRMQKLDSRSTAMHWQLHKDGRMDYLATDGRLEVAVALGLDPVSAYSALGAAAEAHRRVHARGLPQGRAGRARARARRSTSRCRRTRRSCSRATWSRAT